MGKPFIEYNTITKEMRDDWDNLTIFDFLKKYRVWQIRAYQLMGKRKDRLFRKSMITPEVEQDYITMELKDFLKKYKMNYATAKKYFAHLTRTYKKKISAATQKNIDIVAKYWKENIIQMAKDIWVMKTLSIVWLTPIYFHKNVLWKEYKKTESIYEVIAQKRSLLNN